MRSATRHFTMIESGRLRARMEAAIETMLALLDELEDDSDLEPDTDLEPGADDEPTLGWPESGVGALGENTFLPDEAEDDPAEWGLADRDALDILAYE